MSPLAQEIVQQCPIKAQIKLKLILVQHDESKDGNYWSDLTQNGKIYGLECE